LILSGYLQQVLTSPPVDTGRHVAQSFQTNAYNMYQVTQSYRALGTHFSCFTGTKVQILTQLASHVVAPRARYSVFLLSSTKVQILTQKAFFFASGCNCGAHPAGGMEQRQVRQGQTDGSRRHAPLAAVRAAER
jgi:hypothetical protein